MYETAKLRLPLIEAGQAQKHVTVNEALVRIDAICGRRVEGFGALTPPATPGEGDAWIVGAGASGAWSGQGGRIAIRVNGGWDFLEPFNGLELWDAGAAGWRFFDGVSWSADRLSGSSRGAATLCRVVEVVHAVGAGATSLTTPVIPDKAVVLGVTARVDAVIAGPASWQLGVAESPDRYGSGIGTAAGSYAHGVSASPVAYYGGTPLLMTAEAGSFGGGSVVFAVHLLELVPPRPL